MVSHGLRTPVSKVEVHDTKHHPTNHPNAHLLASYSHILIDENTRTVSYICCCSQYILKLCPFLLPYQYFVLCSCIDPTSPQSLKFHPLILSLIRPKMQAKLNSVHIR